MSTLPDTTVSLRQSSRVHIVYPRRDNLGVIPLTNPGHPRHHSTAPSAQEGAEPAEEHPDRGGIMVLDTSDSDNEIEVLSDVEQHSGTFFPW